MSNMGCILSGISLLLTLSMRYKRICENPEEKAKTAYFGIYAIVTSAVAGGLFLLSVWGVIALMGAMETAGLGVILMWVFVAMLILVTIFLFAEYIFGGLLGVIYQFRCNRQPITWVALGIFIGTTCAMIAGFILILTAVSI